MAAKSRAVAPRTISLPFHKGILVPHSEQEMMNLLTVVGDAELPDVAGAAAEPFVGITNDGDPLPHLFTIRNEGFDAKKVTAAAGAYLESLSADMRQRAVLALDATEWRHWINAFLTFDTHGVLIDELTPEQRDRALALVAASLSAEGLSDIRETMRLNAELGVLCAGYEDTLREFMYWLTIFGTPSADEPWGWQLFGHHLAVHCLIFGRQIVLTPSFHGAEHNGDMLFAEHARRGADLFSSLSVPQRRHAILYPSIQSADLPHHLSGAIDGRHRAGAGRDNEVIPYEGVRGGSLTRGQRELLMALIGRYLINLPDGPRQHRMAQIEQHLDDTYFAWIGPCEEGEAFYYKVHSPVVLIEYDNHSGIFLDNPEAAPYHVHTIVRTPNGNDYGKDLLRQHYDRFHRNGSLPPTPSAQKAT